MLRAYAQNRPAGANQQSLADACRWFADQAKPLDAVKDVLLEKAEDSYTLWVILDKEPRNRQLKHQIYNLYRECVNQLADEYLDIRLINVTEFDNPAAINLPQEYTVLYRRG